MLIVYQIIFPVSIPRLLFLFLYILAIAINTLTTDAPLDEVPHHFPIIVVCFNFSLWKDGNSSINNLGDITHPLTPGLLGLEDIKVEINAIGVQFVVRVLLCELLKSVTKGVKKGVILNMFASLVVFRTKTLILTLKVNMLQNDGSLEVVGTINRAINDGVDVDCLVHFILPFVCLNYLLMPATMASKRSQ